MYRHSGTDSGSLAFVDVKGRKREGIHVLQLCGMPNTCDIRSHSVQRQ